MITEQEVRAILAAAGHPELAQEGTAEQWRITSAGWDVFTYRGRIRVSWWSEGTLSADPRDWAADTTALARLKPALVAAGLTVTDPDSSVLEVTR